MPNKFIEKLAIDLAISCEGNTTRTQRIENTLKALTSYRDEILKVIPPELWYKKGECDWSEDCMNGYNLARTEIINKIKGLNEMKNTISKGQTTREEDLINEAKQLTQHND